MGKKLSTKQITGLLVGTAIGDAIGLPREGLSPKRAYKLFGGKLQHNLIITPWGRMGLCSDDTEHAVIVGQCLLDMTSLSDSFIKLLANRLRWWFLTLPTSLGMATLKACMKLCLGVTPNKAGIKSAGNGAVMRAPIIGWFFANDLTMMEHILRESTTITHSDPRAFEGAWVVAMAVRHLVNHQPKSVPIDSFFEEVLPTIKGEELIQHLLLAKEKLYEQLALEEYLSLLHLSKRGITGYVNYTVPAVIYAWLRYYSDYQKTITSLVLAGGDTDTNAAIAGALAGVTVSETGIPKEWLKGVKEWPMTMDYIRKLAIALANKKLNPNKKTSIKPLNKLFLLLRNLVFLLIVLVHGLRRLLPPY